MTRWTRTAAVCTLLLALAPAAWADPNVLPIAGAGSSTANDVPATDALFGANGPAAVAVIHDFGSFYRDYVIADPANCRVRRATPPANPLTEIGPIATVVGNGCSGVDAGDANGTAGTNRQLSYPTGVSGTVNHEILIADLGAGRVDRWNGSTVTTVAGTFQFPANCSTPPADGSSAKAATFCNLVRVAANPDDPDRFLIVDEGKLNDQGQVTFPGRVYEVYKDVTLKIKTVAGGCSVPATPASRHVCFTDPLGVAWRDDTEFLVTDAIRNQVFHFSDADDTLADIVANETGQPTAPDGSNFGDGGKATDATFSQPSDVAMTADGGYFIADTYNCTVRKVTDFTSDALIFAIAGRCGDAAAPDRAPVSAFVSNLWPFGLALASGGLYMANPTTGQIQLLDRTTITNGPPAFTSSTAATFAFESLENASTFKCKLDNNPEQTCTPPFNAPSPLAETAHTFSVYADTDSPAVDPDPTPATRSWTVDKTPPQGLALLEPADGAAGLPAVPAFSWQAAQPGASGIDHYELFIDGANAADVACSTATCTKAAPTPLSEGPHTWKVRAVDGAGNDATTGERTLASGSPPVAAFSIAPNPALVGRSVTFDGSGSSDTSGPIKRYEWDLDGDGSFETDSGGTAQVAKTYSTPGPVPIQLRVTDGVGLTAVAAATLTVATPSLSSQIGVTIENGARYTNNPAVTLSVVAPQGVSNLLVANDGGFLAAKTFAAATQVPWVLDSSGPERLPKTVYLRFLFGAFPSPNYTDDIILDERPPTVSQASVAPAVAAAAARASKLTRWKVRVKASDSNSGVAGVQVTVNKKKPGKLLRYKSKLGVKSAKRPRFLRARDRAGNYSRWKKLR